METIKLKAPKGATGVSFDGAEYAVDKKGFVTVPTEAVAALAPHGYTADAGEAPKAEGEQPAA